MVELGVITVETVHQVAVQVAVLAVVVLRELELLDKDLMVVTVHHLQVAVTVAVVVVLVELVLMPHR